MPPGLTPTIQSTSLRNVSQSVDASSDGCCPLHLHRETLIPIQTADLQGTKSGQKNQSFAWLTTDGTTFSLRRLHSTPRTKAKPLFLTPFSYALPLRHIGCFLSFLAQASSSSRGDPRPTDLKHPAGERIRVK